MRCTPLPLAGPGLDGLLPQAREASEGWRREFEPVSLRYCAGDPPGPFGLGGGRGEEVALVTIVASTGSTPQRVGAKMLVYADGRTVGTIRES